MRQKKAKALRRIAREATIGQKEKEYYRRGGNSPIMLAPTCTRGYYRLLKKLLR